MKKGQQSRRSREMDTKPSDGFQDTSPLLDRDDLEAGVDRRGSFDDIHKDHDYVSDSAIGDLRDRDSRSAAGIRASLQTMIHTQAARAALPPKSPSNAAHSRVLVAPVSRAKSSGVKERQHMPKFQAVRDKKQRKKNIARHLRTDEVETFRGRVSAYCISMELETDKLLPFLEKWKHDGGCEGAQMRNQMAKRGDRDAEGPDGEWNFKMYTDVLHAESRGVDAEVADQLAVASKTIQQELEKKSRAAASNLKREKSHGVSDADEKVGLDELVGSPPEVGSPEDWNLKKKVDIMIGGEFSDEEYYDDMPLAEMDNLHRAAATIADLGIRHIFCFQYGCLVFWGMTPEEEKQFIDLVMPLAEDMITGESGNEQDDMTFFYGTKTRLMNDEVSLSSNGPLEKLSISFAMAQSIKLSVLELRVEETFESTRVYPAELAEKGAISLEQTEVSKMIGHLFIVKAGVNLESDMLSTPDWFWDNDEWEPVYKHALKYLEVDNRVNILNKRMEVMSEMFEMLRNQLEVRHATRLEWIIIWLIVIEVLLEVCWNIMVKDIMGFFAHCCGE